MTGWPNTPGFVGYGLAYLVSAAAFSFGIGLWLEASVVGAALCVLEMTPAIAVWGIPLASLMVPVHLLCRRSANQLVHVAVAGAAGAVGMVLFWSLPGIHLPPDVPLGFVLAGGLATAIGRASVIPLLHWRRTPPFLLI